MAEQKNEVVKQQSYKPTCIADYLAQPVVKDQIINVLGEKEATAFVSDVVACVQNNPQLSQCTYGSIFSGALIAKTIGLPLTPTLGYAYLVPFDNRKKDGSYVKEAQYQMGYKGYVQLALRSGQYRKLVATDVREGEILEYDAFNDCYKTAQIPFKERIEKTKDGKWKIPIIGYYGKMELLNGFTKELFISLPDMVKHAQDYSKAYRRDIEKHTSFSYWTTKFDDMANKTIVRQLLGKWGLLTPELQKAYESDMGVIGENGEITYVDNMPDDKRETLNPMADEEEVVIDSTAIDIEMPENFK